MVKDIGIALELAKRSGLSTPLSALGKELWEDASRPSEKGSSISYIVRWISR
jgi:3-hydroxyisobutyrate dehydrogenase-like beta-hydroxyacid dehydrogenase